jgi:hypothetical protein
MRIIHQAGAQSVCLLVILAAASCTLTDSANDHFRDLLPVGELIQLERRIELEQPDEHPVGSGEAVMLWRGQYLLADRLQGNLKLYSPEGRLVRTIGRPGEGPGEFRLPYWLAASEDEGFVVLDMANSALSRFDSAGVFIERVHTPVARVGGLASAARGGSFLVSGYLSSPGQNGFSAMNTVHSVGGDGRVVTSFGALPTTSSTEDLFLAEVNLLRVGSLVAGVRRNRATVVLHDLESGREWKREIQSPVYVHPDWREYRRMAGFEEHLEWANRQMWIMGLLEIDASHFAVQFAGPGDGIDGRAFHYAVLDTDGNTIATTTAADAPVRSLGNAPGQAFFVEIDENGGATLNVYRVLPDALATGAQGRGDTQA